MSSSKFPYHPENMKTYAKISTCPLKKYANPDPKYFSSQDEKKNFCDSLNGFLRRHISITCPNPKEMGNVKTMQTFKEIVKYTKTKKSIITNGVIVEEIIGGEGDIVKQVRMVFEITSKSAVSIGSFLWKFYSVFPDYHYIIQMDITNKSKFLPRARELVAPKDPPGHIEIDKNPFLYKGTLPELLTQVENYARGVERKRAISLDWSQELIDAATDASGCWTRFIKSAVYIQLSEYYPYHCRSAFDMYSNSSLKGFPDEPLFPTYSKCHFSPDILHEIGTSDIDFSPGYTQEEQEQSYEERIRIIKEEMREEETRKEEIRQRDIQARREEEIKINKEKFWEYMRRQHENK